MCSFQWDRKHPDWFLMGHRSSLLSATGAKRLHRHSIFCQGILFNFPLFADCQKIGDHGIAEQIAVLYKNSPIEWVELQSWWSSTITKELYAPLVRKFSFSDRNSEKIWWNLLSIWLEPHCTDQFFIIVIRI